MLVGILVSLGEDIGMMAIWSKTIVDWWFLQYVFDEYLLGSILSLDEDKLWT